MAADDRVAGGVSLCNLREIMELDRIIDFTGWQTYSEGSLILAGFCGLPCGPLCALAGTAEG